MKKLLGNCIVSCCISVLILTLAEGILVFLGGQLSLPVAAAALAGLTALLFLLCRKWEKKILTGTAVLFAVLAAVMTALWIGWQNFSENAGYQVEDSGKAQLFSDRRVMLVVPHQDDDLNILGGVMEEYVRYGSELYAVFLTNGDYAGLARTRYQEALDVFSGLGVPADHVIFLGYGNEWKAGGPHIYNAEPDAVMESHFGRTQTYGTDVRGAYREGREYTLENLTENLKSVILEHRPDVLFCSDYDHHIDHKATTLLFDKVMGQILKQTPDYRPAVYKAYAYGTAWEAEPDYYKENVLSTRDLFVSPYSQLPAVYRWEDRIRFPVDGSMLSRSLMGSGAYAQLKLYTSQGAQWQAAGIVNGDKVAWQRRTDSLCLEARVDATSGNAALLHDFMLIENSNLVDSEHLPYDGVWTPDPEDGEKKVTVSLSGPSDLSCVVLYDHPAPDQNVKKARITFADGTSVDTGPLDPGGAATEIAVEKSGVGSFCVTLLETEGELAGLSELEAFSESHRKDGRFLKLTDEEGNFLYDHLMPESGTAQLHLYTWGELPPEAALTVETSPATGNAVLEDGVIRVVCPEGEAFSVTVSCPEAGVSDSISVRNPGPGERAKIRMWQKAEEAVYTFLRTKGYRNMTAAQLYSKISYKLRH